MKKPVRKILICTFLMILLSVSGYIFLLLYPSILYAHKTAFGSVTVHHNEPLPLFVESVVNNAFEIIRRSDLFDPNVTIDLCMRDGSVYPELHPFRGGIAYSFLNKSLIYDSQPNFELNISEYSSQATNFKQRKVDLTWLLAHEFTHNLQFNWNFTFMLKTEFWQQEGYAEYVSRQWKNDGKLKERIQKLVEEEQKEHEGLPVFVLPDGTVQLLSYFKYGIMVQYLIEQDQLNFPKICDDKRNFDQVYDEMMSWYN